MHNAQLAPELAPEKNRRYHAKLTPSALGRYATLVQVPGDPVVNQLQAMELAARRWCGRRRIFGVIPEAEMRIIAFEKLMPANRRLNPKSNQDKAYVRRALDYWCRSVGAASLTDGQYKLNDFQLGNTETGTLGWQDMAKERRRMRRVKADAKARERKKNTSSLAALKWKNASITKTCTNVAPYLSAGFTSTCKLSYPRAASVPRLKPRTTVPIAPSPKATADSGVRHMDIELKNLLADRQAHLDRKRQDDVDADALSQDLSLLASQATDVVLDTDLGSQDSSVAASAPADAPEVAPGDLGLDSLLSLGGEQTPNTDCTGPETLSLEERLQRLAAMDDGLDDGLSAAEYTQAEHAADFGESCVPQTPRHGGMPTVPITPGLPVTPVFMAQFKKKYPEFEGVNVRVLIRERLTQTHLSAAAAGTRRSKQAERRPGMLVYGARQLRDEVWGVRSDYLVGMR